MALSSTTMALQAIAILIAVVAMPLQRITVLSAVLTLPLHHLTLALQCLTLPLQPITMAVQRVNYLLHPLSKDPDVPATTSPLKAVIAAIEWRQQSHWLRRSSSQLGSFARAQFGE